MVEVATLRTLLATVPSEFVAARTEVAKELRASGDRDGAEAVKALRRLGISDWALNVAAGEDPEAAAAFCAAAADVLDAQDDAMAGRGGGELRARMKTLRTRSSDLVAAAAAVAERHGARGAGSSPIEIGTRLGEIAANGAAIDLLRDGLIGAADPGVADPFGVVGTARDAEPAGSASASDRQAAPSIKSSRPSKSRTSSESSAPQKKRAAKTASSSDATASQVNELERRRSQRRARADAEQAAKAAAAAVAATETALTKAKAVASKAAGRVADAEARLAEMIAARDAADASVAAAEDAHRQAVVESERAVAAWAASS